LAFANKIGGGCCDDNALMTLAEARQEVNDFLSCVLRRAGMDTIMLKLLGTSVGTLFGEKCTAGMQADPDPNLESLELDVDVVSGRLNNALIECFSDGVDNRECCSDKGVPKCVNFFIVNSHAGGFLIVRVVQQHRDAIKLKRSGKKLFLFSECIYLCGGGEQYFGVSKLVKETKQHGRSPLMDNCMDNNLEIFECHFENRKSSNSKKLMGKLVAMEKMKREKRLLPMKGFFF
jgi:hypothetical protein